MDSSETPQKEEAPASETPANASSDGTPAAASLKRKRQPRNSACLPCAALKMKCVASAEPGKCARCYRMDRDCIPAIPKPRKRRNHDGLHSPAVAPIAAILDSSPSIPTPPKPFLGKADRSADSAKASSFRNDLQHTGSKSYVTLLAHGLSIDATRRELLSSVDPNAVQTSFAIFRDMNDHFPFVVIRPDEDEVNFAAKRPMLTLAICAVTSSAHRHVQEQLVHAFRLALSTKVIVEGERSLDLLMALLVYLAWHHHYMSRQQIYQELCLLAGMATDLGLYQSKPRTDSADVHAAVERDRVFLGCYYVCCGLSVMGFNKPSPLRWTDNLRWCAENVAYGGGQPADRTFVAIVELLHTIEDLEEVLRTERDLKRSTFAYYFDMHTKATNSRLKALKRQHPELSGTLGYTAATIHFQHRLLRASDTPDTSTLVMCACAIKEYIDDILSQPPITLHQMAIVDWTNLLEILVLMARVSKPLPQTAGWEAGALSSMLQPDIILDAICNHMESAPTNKANAPRDEALLHWFRGVCYSIKRRILHDRGGSGTSTSTLRNDESQYDTVRSLGQSEPAASAEARFRPVNEALPPPPMFDAPFGDMANFDSDSFNFFGNGVLDEVFWNSFMIAT